MKSVLNLVPYTHIKDEAYDEYMAEWEASGEVVVPRSSARNGLDFRTLLARWALDETEEPRSRGFVPSTQYFLVQENQRLVGSLSFRHDLTDRLRQNGGHVGYGVRPSERRKGYAACMLRAVLGIARARGMERLMLSCDDTNLASVRTIESCGGILEDRLIFEGTLTRRYWISL